MTSPEQHPIPDADRYVAGVLTELRIEPYISGGKWRFEITEEQMMALATRIFVDGRAAGRTPPTNPDDLYLTIATGIDALDPAECAASPSFRATVDDAVAAGRTAAAADIRAEIVDEPAHENLRMMNAAFALAARVAENGADR
jgi:alkyl hydroperoxide reductase subunit AhpF